VRVRTTSRAPLRPAPLRPAWLRPAWLGLAAPVAAATLAVLMTAPAAWADSGGSSSPGASGQAGAPPGSNLGGFTLSSSAAGLSVYYEQPNFPIPATPTFEFDLGYSSATYDAGPVGTANGSALWPGPVIAGGGSQLPLLIDPYLQQYAGPLASTIEPLVPTAGAWPIQASSAYPQGPQTATNDNGPLAMNSSTNDSGSTASSALALIGGANTSLPAGMLTVQAVGSTSQDTIDSLGNAVSEATSTVHGIDIAGGLIHIGAVESTASSSSDGNNATLSGASNVTDVTVAGEAVTVGSNGITVPGNPSGSGNPLAALAPNVNQVLSTAGITMTLTSPTDTVSGASGQRQLDGLKVTIDLSTYDQDFTSLLAMLPSSLTSGLDQLPVPTPYRQSITIDLGWVQVNAAASPAFNPSLTLPSPGGGLSTLGSTGTSGTPAIPGTPGTAGTTGTTGTAAPTPTVRLPAASTPALFKGIGTGLIILGLILAALLTAFLLGADRAVGRLAAAVPCVGEDIGDLG
jgi:hypothetical protein